YGTPSAPRFLLVDGGPNDVYEPHLHAVLETIRDDGGELDLVVLSHIDRDHVTGLLDLTTDLQWQRIRDIPETISIGELWHNSFSRTLGSDLEDRLNRILDRAGSVRSALPHSDKTSRDIAQGDELTRSAENLGLPINPSHRFGPQGIITVDQATQPIIFDNLTLRIVGPNQTNLENLKEDWLEWLQEQEDRVLVPDPGEAERAARSLDTRVPNLSSIMFLAEADERAILFTGDGRSDHLQDGLRQAGLLDPHGRLHVDVLKLPHHGSKYNITLDFLQTVTADQYVISASGYHGHPNKDTLRWIVQAAHDQGRDIEIVATNSTRSLRDLVEEYDPSDYGYRLTVMPEGSSQQVLELVA
ncbi:MAG: ComEC/Rec2 family competence protein, partial [Anaerolineae bacterium]